MIEAVRRLFRRNAEVHQEAPDWKRQGNDFLARGEIAEAMRCYRAAVDADPGDAAARLNLGFALLEQNFFQEARHWLQEVLRLQPGQHEAHFLLARAVRAQGALESAAQSYQQAVRYEPGFELARQEGAEVCVALGQRELEAGRPEAARAWLDDAIARSQGHPSAPALVGRANTFLMQDRHEEALAAYDRALASFPDSALAHLNRGNTLLALRRQQDALQAFRRALQLQPGYVEALVNIGSVLNEQGRHAEANASFEQALAHDPSNAAAHWNLALGLLVQGRLQDDWLHAEWRWQALGRERLDTGRPQWTGAEPLAGKTILVHHEQGFGDTVQFCRYIPLLAQRGATVLVSVQRGLENLVRTLPGSFRVLEPGEPIPDHDYASPLLSLPLAFDTRVDAIPAAVPYLASRPELVAKWRERLGPARRRRVGIVWSGNASQVNDHNRSMPLAHLLPLAGPGVQLVSLQKEARPADIPVLQAAPITHFGEQLADFEQTAALVECMDVVVSVCTSVAHVAGALGRPLWVLLPFNADWRWLQDRSDSPWYPSARLFRQPRPGDWDSVVRTVQAELQGLDAPEDEAAE